MEKTEWLSELNESALVYNQINDAIIGAAYVPLAGWVAVYDSDMIIEILIDDMSKYNQDNDKEQVYLDALEYYEFNILNSWIGECTPLFTFVLDDMDFVNDLICDMKIGTIKPKTIKKIVYQPCHGNYFLLTKEELDDYCVISGINHTDDSIKDILIYEEYQK